MKSSRYTFVLMFTIALLLNTNFTILRSLRTTLAVVDLGGGSHSIPFFELFGTMPCAFLMTWCLTHLMNRYSIEKVFVFTIATFIGLFIFFKAAIYPYLLVLKEMGSFGNLVRTMMSMLFYTVSELWKPALSMILFWGLINKYTVPEDAKKLYAPLMLSGSLGAIVAGPITSICTSKSFLNRFFLSTDHWGDSINLMILFISLLGWIIIVLYGRLWRILSRQEELEIGGKKEFHDSSRLAENIHICLKNGQLRLLSWIVIADYISYSLGEVIFLDILKYQFPQSADYCNYMGNLSLWCGILTLISSVFATPFILKNYRWVVAAMITPMCVLITEGAFFLILRGYSLKENWFGWTEATWIGLAILLGSIQYCLCRAAKYALFDSSKELAFVLMPEAQRMKGKLIIDGLCARIGRGGSSLLSIALMSLHGGVLASSFSTGLLAIGLVLSWLHSTLKLGNKFYENSKTLLCDTQHG